MIDRRLANGRWEIVHRGVYLTAGTPLTWRAALLGACLAAGRAVASHRAAAALWSFPNFEAAALEISVPKSTSARFGDVVVHRTRAMPPQDVSRIDGIPVTSGARTLIDLAAVVTRTRLEEALDDALVRRVTSLRSIQGRVADLGGRGRPGTAILRALLEQRDPHAAVPQSVLETRLLRVIRQARLPDPVAQYPVKAHGRLIAVLDFAYPDHLVAIEADGFRWHGGRARWEQDLARRNSLTALGWRIDHVTWADLSNRPIDVVGRIRSLLTRT